MKTTITLIALLFSALTFSQEKFVFFDDGSADFIVYNVPSMKASDLYEKTINWINTAYKNPNEVIKAKVPEGMIRIEGFDKEAFSRKFSDGTTGFYGVGYTMEFEFQDGKYRVKYSHNKTTIEGKSVHFPISNVIENTPDVNGNDWPGARDQYEKSVQNHLDSLYSYLTKPKQKF